MKRFIASVLAGLAVIVSSVGVANAQSNPILEGLWEGINMAFGVSSSPTDRTTDPRTPEPVPKPHVPTPTPTAGTYAALGDSVAAGAGLPGLVSATARDTQCGRSASAYPYQIARARNLTLAHQACSGAKAGDLFTRQGVEGPNIPPQLDAAFASGAPQLITITAGANDAHWVEFIRACYSWDCNTATQTALANAYLTALQLKLYYLFYDIQARSGGSPPPVIMTGYYNPLSQQCLNLQRNITADELDWLDAEVTALNQTIQNVSAQFDFVRFAPASFAGHDLCSSDPWVQGLADSAPFHPNAAGQQAIAQSVMNAL